jgi:hypothetical protein
MQRAQLPPKSVELRELQSFTQQQNVAIPLGSRLSRLSGVSHSARAESGLCRGAATTPSSCGTPSLGLNCSKAEAPDLGVSHSAQTGKGLWHQAEEVCGSTTRPF